MVAGPARQAGTAPWELPDPVAEDGAVPKQPRIVLASHGDALLAVAVLAAQCALALFFPDRNGHRPDAVGWTLLVVSALLLTARRRVPMAVMIATVLTVGPYHALDNLHVAVVPASMVAVYSLAVAGPPLRTFPTVTAVVGIMASVMAATPDRHAVGDMLRSGGWVLAMALVGEAVRIQRKYVAAVVERAERAMRTREEEAARRVAEERLRIARDLHDLLAHSITVIGVQTSVAAHVLLADPDRLDRTAVAGALDNIAETCRDARTELRATLQVLRGDDERGPLPGLAGVTDLARSAEAAGARVELAVAPGADGVPPAIGAAAYRIVQEALTNAVRHAGGGTRVRVGVSLDAEVAALRIAVTDDGPRCAEAAAPAPPHQDGRWRPWRAMAPSGPPQEEPAPVGYGLVGMRERARSVGGTLTAGPSAEGGFAVAAVLPLGGGGALAGGPA
ncbi:sensor histidine kinase [Actinacidiphila glaucinigra]|uniref:sensor histidine kinase n=1 Tax=Actinacidiphila glaucinigra TaxID=235986 RepID=UPI003713224F